LKKLGSESVGPKLSRQKVKGSQFIPMAHPKVAIVIMDTPGHFSTQLSIAQDFADLQFEILALINNRVVPEFLELMETKGYELQPRQNSAIKSFRDIFNIPPLGILSNGNTWNFFSIPGLDHGKTDSQQAKLRKLGFRSIWKSISRSYRNSLLIWPEFNFFYGHLSIFRLLKKAKIPQAIYPYSLVNEEEWKVAFAKNVARTRDGLVNRIIDLAFPAWTRFSDGKKLRLPVGFPIAATLARYHTYNPWLAGANMSIPIFTPDSFTYRYLQKAGYSSEHLHIAGMPGGGRLISIKKSKPSKPLHETGLKSQVLIAIPPNQISQRGNQDYRKLISDTILNPLSKLSDLADFKFALHPRLDESSRDWFKNLGLEILDGELSEHIARTDLYIACASATLRIAESLGVPAINFDIYKYRYGDFEGARFVMTAKDPIHFVHLLQKLLKQPFVCEVDMALGTSPAASIINFLNFIDS
jgi:hypothetical protein